MRTYLKQGGRPISAFLTPILAILLFFSQVEATNGYFRHGYGVQYRGLAGAGVALYLGPLGMATNPASVVWLPRQLDFGFSLFVPQREYSVIGNPSGFPGTFPLAPGTIESQSTLFLIPDVGMSLPLPGARHSLGLVIFGNGGMNTDYPVKTFDNPQLEFEQPTGVDLSQLFASATYANELVIGHSVGISAIFAYQRFKAEGLFAFSGFSNDPAMLTNNDHANSSGFGIRAGYLGEWLPKLSVGISYQTKVYMSEFDKYAGLFAENGDFDIPANWTAGIAFKPTRLLTIAADFQQIFYSGVQSVGNPLAPAEISPVLPDGITPNPGFIPLGAEAASGFGWEDVAVYKLGMQYQFSSATTLRGGFSYCEQPVQGTEVLFNILAPGIIDKHLTLGFTQKLGDNLMLNGSFMHGLSNTVSGLNPFEAPGQQEVELTMRQFEGEIGLSINL